MEFMDSLAVRCVDLGTVWIYCHGSRLADDGVPFAPLKFPLAALHHFGCVDGQAYNSEIESFLLSARTSSEDRDHMSEKNRSLALF